MPPLDRRDFIAALGGAAAVSLMSHEARADALEDALMARSNGAALAMAAATGHRGHVTARFPTVAELEAQVPDLPRRRGTGSLLFPGDTDGGKLRSWRRCPPSPPSPTSSRCASTSTRNHCLQSATLALKNGADEEVVLACLLHDTVL